MKTLILALSGLEVTRLLRAETIAANGQPELDTTCEKDFRIEEDFDRNAYGIAKDEWFDLVTSMAVLTIEPRRESGYWILSVAVERVLGLVRTFDEGKMRHMALTLDEFELELRSARRKDVTVRLDVQTPEVKQGFDAWLAEMRTRHPWKAVK
ncbi:MAG: hypothetical protein ABI145_12605 [Steroidobacteraceae bacterium]